jgi:hypothetical protein
MGKKYTTQPISVSLSWTEANSPDAAIVSSRIKYKKPNGSIGFWTSVYDEPNKTIYYNGSTTSSYGMTGKWTFWPWVTLTDGRCFPGEPISEIIYLEGE